MGGKRTDFPGKTALTLLSLRKSWPFMPGQRLGRFKKRLASMIVAYTVDGQPVTAGMLGVQGALALLLKMLSNQTLFRLLKEHRRSSTEDRLQTSPTGQTV
ncbi:formate--tetrahydrofolate ligase [Bacillus licheniformis]|nr:formate--tetrahydrofolate ligase [Bacillus licheniformis]